MKLIINGRYNWSHDKQTLLIFIGKKGSWNQFVKVDAPDDVWCEALDEDLHMLEESAMNNQTVPDDVIERLQRFRDATDFWDKHEYSTRLYFGDGADDFIHRHNLDTVIAELQRQREAVAQHEVGEAVPDYMCRMVDDIGNGGWEFVDKEEYDKAHPEERMIVYTPPLPQDARELLEKAIAICDETASFFGENGEQAEHPLHVREYETAKSIRDRIRALIPTEKEPS